MCSHENVTWEAVCNTVSDRMIDNSLIYKFMKSRIICRRTKILNSEIRHRNVKDYRQYIEIKTDILRDLSEDTDTDDINNLSDIDYSIIYSSQSTLANYTAENSMWFTSFTDEEDEKNHRRRKRKRSSSSSREKRKNNAESKKKLKKCINVDWQEVVKKSRDTTRLSNNKRYIDTLNNNKGNTLRNNKHDYLKAPSERPISTELDSQDSKESSKMEHVSENSVHNCRNLHMTINKSHLISHSQDDAIFCEMQCIDQDTMRNHRDSTGVIANELICETVFPNSTVLDEAQPADMNTVGNRSNTVDTYSKAVMDKSNSELYFQNNATSSKAKHINNSEVEDYKNSNTLINKLKSESDYKDNTLSCKGKPILNLQSSNYKVSPSRLTSLENVNKSFVSTSDEELSRLKNCNTEKLTKMNDKILINAKNHNNTYVSRKASGSLDNVKRNLMSMLDNVDFTNDNGGNEKDQSAENELNCNQLLRHIVSSLLKRIQIQILKNLQFLH